jgi:tetratricopeptide (TPR) repeat protein
VESSALRPVAAARFIRRALAVLDASGSSGAEPGGDVEALTLRTRLMMTRAKVESELFGAERGLALLEESSRLFAVGADVRLLAGYFNQRGVLRIRFGRLREAIAEFDEAERHFAGASPLDRANVLLNRGSAQMMLGALSPAARDLARCAQIARDAELSLLQSMSLHNLGYVDFLRGDLPQALARMHEAAEQLGEPHMVNLLDRARVLAEAGLVREADETLARATKIMHADRLAQELGEAELERARCALIADDVDGARRLAARARDRFRRRGNDAWRRTAELVLLQADLAAGRPPRRLVAPALRVRDEFAAEGMTNAARTAALIAAQAQLWAGDTDSAADLLAEVGPASAASSITTRLHRRYVGALLDRQRGWRPAAQRQIRGGLADLTAYQARFGSLDLQTAAAVHGRHLAQLGVTIALESGAPDTVFAAAEQARAVSTRLPPVRPPADDGTAELIAELRQVVESARGAERDRAAQADRARRRHDLERRVAARRWGLVGAGDAAPAAVLGDIQHEAAHSELAVAVFVGSQGMLHALVVTATGTRLTALGRLEDVLEPVRRVRADLDVLAQPHLPAGLRSAAQRSLRRSTGLLDDALVRPLHTDAPLVVISTGMLGQVPWGLLPSLRGVPVSVASSGTAWLTAARAPRSRRRTVAAFAGPGLDRGEQEAVLVAAAWRDGKVLAAERAVCTEFTRAMGRARVLHVAAHGTHQAENPLFSSLRLSDGVLFAHELDEGTRTPDHVVLSACELGLATVRPGDEALGLASVLLRQGTRCVVAGVARVGDEVAAESMVDYHRQLAAGVDAATALAQVTEDRIAPFVCFGSSWRTAPVRH